MGSRNPRYCGPGGWKARAAVLRAVYERAAAGEPCGICGRAIDVDAPQWRIDPKDGRRKRAPWSLECDEVVPVSRGGSPTDPANVRPAHRLCNQRRGARLDGWACAPGGGAPDRGALNRALNRGGAHETAAPEDGARW